MTIVYKVFHVGKGHTLESVWVYDTPWNHVYNVREVILPRVGRLAAFDTLDAALDLAFISDEVWVCEGEDPIVVPRIPVISLSSHLVEKFWAGAITQRDPFLSKGLNGAVWCKSIKLIAKVVK